VETYILNRDITTIYRGVISNGDKTKSASADSKFFKTAEAVDIA